MTIPASASTAIRAVLSTPLEKVLTELSAAPPPPHHRAVSSGPGGARFVGGHGGGPQRVITLNHNTTVADALEKLARHRILSAPVVVQPDLLVGCRELNAVGTTTLLTEPSLKAGAFSQSTLSIPV